MDRCCAARLTRMALAFVVAVSGCESTEPERTMVSGIVSLDEPIQGATVSVYDREMEPLLVLDGASNAAGAFQVAVPNDRLEGNAGYLVLEAAGGVYAGSGKPFAGKLYYLVQGHDPETHSFYHLGPLSTIIAYCKLEHPERSVERCITDVKRLLGIPAVLDHENDLYYFEAPLPPAVLRTKAEAQGGLDAYLRAIAGHLEQPSGFDPCMIGRCAGSALGSSSDAAIFIGKALARGALSSVGGELAGWVLSGLSDNSAGELDGIRDDLDQILGQLTELKVSIDSVNYDVRVANLLKGLGYLESWNEKIQMAASLEGAQYTSYVAQRKKELLDLKPTDDDLIEIHQNLVGQVGLKALLDLADQNIGDSVGHGKDFYKEMSAFMTYWGVQQNLLLNLLGEYKHLIDDAADLERILNSTETRFTAQSKRFIELVERNLAVDKHGIRGGTEKTSKSALLGYEQGYDLSAGEDWVKASWSAYPDYSILSHEKNTDCHRECAPGTPPYCWDQCYPQTWYYGSAYSYTRASSTYQPSRELQQADELVFALSIFEEKKPITLRFYVDPWRKNAGCVLDALSDDRKVVGIRNQATGKVYTAAPVIYSFPVPPDLYLPASQQIKTSPPWANGAQVARYTFRDLPQGTYKLDQSVKGRFKLDHTMIPGICSASGNDQALLYASCAFDYYSGHGMTYTPDGPAQNMAILLFEAL